MEFLTRYADCPPYRTKDGSEIRELMHPAVHSNRRQSLAEAVVGPGETTRPHRHHESEELYHVVAGTGEMQLGEAIVAVGPGDTICIRPGMAHSLRNTGEIAMRVLCCCSPAYSHDDTELLDQNC